MDFTARILILIKSKTVWGAIFAALGWLLKQNQITLPNIIIAIGMILTAVGVRDSYTKYLGVPTMPAALSRSAVVSTVVTTSSLQDKP